MAPLPSPSCHQPDAKMTLHSVQPSPNNQTHLRMIISCKLRYLLPPGACPILLSQVCPVFGTSDASNAFVYVRRRSWCDANPKRGHGISGLLRESSVPRHLALLFLTSEAFAFHQTPKYVTIIWHEVLSRRGSGFPDHSPGYR